MQIVVFYGLITFQHKDSNSGLSVFAKSRHTHTYI